MKVEDFTGVEYVFRIEGFFQSFQKLDLAWVKVHGKERLSEKTDSMFRSDLSHEVDGLSVKIPLGPVDQPLPLFSNFCQK